MVVQILELLTTIQVVNGNFFIKIKSQYIGVLALKFKDWLFENKLMRFI